MPCSVAKATYGLVLPSSILEQQRKVYSAPATLLLVLLLLHILVLAELEDLMLVSQCYWFSNTFFLAFLTHCHSQRYCFSNTLFLAFLTHGH